LDVNNRFGLGEPGLQARMLAAQLGQLVGQRIAVLCFGATGLGCQGLELTGGAQPSPLDQMRRVQSFAPEERTNLAWLCTGISLLQDAQLGGGAEGPADWLGRHFRVRSVRWMLRGNDD
jgi:hypothetical protein